jgi:DNA-binding transcriptional LysR family regulator
MNWADFTFTAGLVRAGLGTVFMPASEARLFSDLRAVSVRPSPRWPIYLAWTAQGQIGPASAKLAELITASVGPGR